MKVFVEANFLPSPFPLPPSFAIIARMKKLVIAEKPSVGRDIARTLGCRSRGEGFIEGEDYIVTWALGHLVELCEPAHYSDRYKRWSMKDLPMIPETLDEQVIEDSKGQFEVIRALLGRSDVASVVIATDAGREGELVARWILKLCGYSGKAERLWISSQTELAIKEGWNSPRAAILGAAKWIDAQYISNAYGPQNTLYKMKWDLFHASQGAIPWKQYATSATWATGIASVMHSYYSFTNIDVADTALKFEIPSFS